MLHPARKMQHSREAVHQGASAGERRQPKRRMLTGMAVVWKYFGLRDPDAQAL